ncbi:MAG: hypothetical protein J7K46_04245 [Bacteroidales bacterium]|nr:hypothetical protein [Bacteroidales bacterium]
MRVPDKNRIIDAINHVERSDIPFFEIDPDMEIVNQILGKKLPYNLHPFEQSVDDNVELNLRMGNDMLYFSHVWRVGRVEVPDKVGRLHYKDGIIKSRKDLNKVWFPDILAIEKKLEQTIEKLDETCTNMGLMVGAQTAAFTAMTAMGYTDFLMKSVEDPPLVMDMIKMLHEYCLKELEMYLRHPVDMVKVGSGIVTGIGPMVSWEMVERLELSFIREQIRMIKNADKQVFFHIDGAIEYLIPDFVKMGVDVLNPVDTSGGTQDIYELKKTYGDKITLCGNIDINGVLLNGTTEQVREDVIKHMEILGKGGGYIVASSHNLHELIPIENFYAMRDTVMELEFNSKKAKG